MNQKSPGVTLPDKIIGLLIVAFAGLSLAGCAAFQTSTTQILPVATELKPAPGKALVTVAGTPSFDGIIKLYAVAVYDNKTLVGKVGPHGKLIWQRDPGRMILTLGDSVYGADWCLGRVHTLAAGEVYDFKVESRGLRYSIAGPGLSIEDEQMEQFLTAWNQLHKGMSMTDVESSLHQHFGDGVTRFSTGVNYERVGTRTRLASSFYKFQYRLQFDEGKLTDWDPKAKE